MMREWRGVLHTLIGFENSKQDGSGCGFNFILSNGTRSTQRDEHNPTNYTLMIPADALNKIRSVTIHYDGWIVGFSLSFVKMLCFFPEGTKNTEVFSNSGEI